MADKYSFIRVLRRSLKEREEQIQEILMSGGIKDMEKYNFLLFNIFFNYITAYFYYKTNLF